MNRLFYGEKGEVFFRLLALQLVPAVPSPWARHPANGASQSQHRQPWLLLGAAGELLARGGAAWAPGLALAHHIRPAIRSSSACAPLALAVVFNADRATGTVKPPSLSAMSSGQESFKPTVQALIHHRLPTKSFLSQKGLKYKSNLIKLLRNLFLYDIIVVKILLISDNQAA